VENCRGFVLAMRGMVRRGWLPPRREWLIAARWGEGGEFLSLSFTGLPAERRAPPPLGLAPDATLFAVRDGPSGQAAAYLIHSKVPPDVPLAGRFIATRGWIMLARMCGCVRMVACSDHSDTGVAMRMRAVCCPWPAGQFVEPPD